METLDFPPTDINPDVHVVVSKVGKDMLICPTRKVNRLYLMGLLQDALTALASSGSATIDPAYSPLNVFVTIAEIEKKTDWEYGEDEFDEEDDDDEGTPIESR